MNTGVRTLVALALMGHDEAWLRERSRLGPNTIHRLIHDPGRHPSPHTLVRVARVVGTSVRWLTADASQRELTTTEREELLQCVQTLRSLARRHRIDPRSDPNVVREPARRVPRQFAALGARHAYRVRGGSLSGFGLLNGDVVYAKPSSGHRIGDVRDAVGSLIVSRISGVLYLKQLLVTAGGVVVLRSAHDGYDPLMIGADDDWTIMGKVVGSMRVF